LPASMWAMMPMLRVRSRGNSRLAIAGHFRSVFDLCVVKGRGGGEGRTRHHR
jgi:hypothetical protein